jgi:diguanylate cyclase (GGDEF)-like protein/PAS domain S-box-containing protein
MCTVTLWLRLGKLLRSPGFAVGTCTLLVALTAYFVIKSADQYADERRLGQVAITEFEAQLNMVPSGLDGAQLGEGPTEFNEAIEKTDALLAKVRRELPSHTADRVEISYREFSKVAREQLAKIESDTSPSLNSRLDSKATDPAYDQTHAEVTSLRGRLGREAEAGIEESAAAVKLCLFGAAFLVTLLVTVYHRKSMLDALETHRRLSLESSDRRMRAIIRNSSDVIALAAADGTLTMVSDACERAWNLIPSKCIGQRIEDLINSVDLARFTNHFELCLRDPWTEFEVEMRVQLAKDEVLYFQVAMRNLLEDEDVNGVLLTFNDISDRTKFEGELSHQAFHDKLTGLPNRALFLARLSERLKRSGADPLSVLFLDLDNFKVINDSLGHETGDRLLIEVAARIQKVLRPGDTVARLGGDEFTILLDANGSPEEAAAIAKRIIERFEHAIEVDGRELFVTASVGIANSLDGTESADSLLRDADTAMYQAKNQGKSSYVVFDHTMNERAVERLELESDLRAAVDLGQFVLHYQPIVDIQTRELSDVEALIRWQHPTRGLVPPIKFIPVLEVTGLICHVGDWVLTEACRQLRTWKESFPEHRNLRISVNVSGRQLLQPDYVQKVADTLTKFGIEPDQIKLEITESVMLVDLDAAQHMFDDLRALGVRIAIDDFGTGYSSMSYLSKLPVDTLKIDRAFINLLGADSTTDGIVRAIIAMASTLGLSVTSEGIETEEQLATLKGLGCDSGQGFLFSKPMSAAGLTQMLKASEPKKLLKAA